MSYKVLARKWRPQHFDDMSGQEPVLRALINALDSDRLHHAYLFTGMRGVGKTTIARIFAKCLNCEERGVSANPCGQCSACKDIEAGRFFDLIEVDAASRTKVESTRELLENVPYAPASGRYKVYLIDEVHMFSTHSFNALLKTLEEPPEHVKFILATTDPQKVPATVLSRCLQFNLKRMSPSLLTDYLAKVLTQESVEHEMPALELIARASEGSVRDSLSLVEQAAAIGQGAIRADEVESMLGRASVDRLLLLIETLATGDMVALFEQVDQLAEYAPEFSELLGELLSLLHRIAVLQSVPGALADSEPGFDHLVRLAGSIDADIVQLFYQIGLHARRDMPFAPDPRDAFDMALLRMNAFKPQESTGGDSLPSQSAPSAVARNSGSESTANQTDKSAQASPATRLENDDSLAANPKERAQPDTAANNGLPLRGEVSAGGSLRAAALAAARGEYPADGPAPVKAPVTGPVHSETIESTPAESEAQTVPPTAADEGNEDRANIPAPMDKDSAAKLEKTPAIEPAEIDDKTAAIDKDNIKPEDWPTIVNLLDIAGMPLQLASNTLWQGRAGDRVTLRLESDSEHLNKERFVERLREALGNWLGRTVSLTLETVDQTLQTPAKIAEQQRQDALAAAHDSITLDPMVKQLVDSVDGAIDEASIQPLSGS